MWCKRCNMETNANICPVCGETTVEDLPIEIYWCEQCSIPIINTKTQSNKGFCPVCGAKTRNIAADLRPVFPEERLLLEILLDKEPNVWVNQSVWACNNRYYVDGKSYTLTNSIYQTADTDIIKKKLEENGKNNSYTYFESNIHAFAKANRMRLAYLKDEAYEFIKKAAASFPP